MIQSPDLTFNVVHLTLSVSHSIGKISRTTVIQDGIYYGCLKRLKMAAKADCQDHLGYI